MYLKTYPFLLWLWLFASCNPSKQVTRVQTGEHFSKSDSELCMLVEHQTFKYFWEGAEPASGMARERFNENDIYPDNDKNVVTTGGSGFGIMAILAGINEHFITREEGKQRLEKIVSFLEKAERFHGAWSHWIYGETGKVKPFGRKDNGGDLVETSFMLQGLLCVRQYFGDGNNEEKNLSNRIDDLWKAVDFNWYRNGKNVLFWHWSPTYNWEMNFEVTGYNECLIMYILGASSPTHSITQQVYDEGWARKGAINTSTTKYGHTLHFSHNGATEYGGPLFWAHYSYLGLDPHGLKDKYADYWEENKNQALINHDWCADNPKKFIGYGSNNWGLTSSYSVKGYAGHAPGPKRDLGVIAPTAAIASMPYTPNYSMLAMHHWYSDMKDSLWGSFGFYDAFSETAKWFPKQYLAIDQGPIVVMLENYRSGLLWKLFMSCPEVQAGLKKLQFQTPYFKLHVR